jgi:hypothetical protein
MAEKCINALEVGCRVWAEHGYHEHGHDKVNVPAKTGGTVVASWNEFQTIQNPFYRVKWDSGETSVHYSTTLHCTGKFQTPNELREFVLAEAEKAKIVIGPMGGVRSFEIFLRNGDWVTGIVSKEELEARNIQVEVERLERKKRRP